MILTLECAVYEARRMPHLFVIKSILIYCIFITQYLLKFDYAYSRGYGYGSSATVGIIHG